MEFTATSHNMVVTVRPIYLPEESSPDENLFIWSYHVRIKSCRTDTVQLLTRYWRITDANGAVHEVRGDGVIGKQPVLHPNEDFAYQSGTHLPTSSGVMAGTYGMITEDGENFEITIPTFSLDSPAQRARPN
jgi:ApaG protein